MVALGPDYWRKVVFLQHSRHASDSEIDSSNSLVSSERAVFLDAIRALCPDCCHKSLWSHDIHHTLQVVCQDMQTHLGAGVFKGPGHKVR